MSKIKDIYDGEQIQVWEDENIIFVTICYNAITLSILKEDWPTIKEELLEMLQK